MRNAAAIEKLLVIKLGALGDVVQAFGAFREIRLAYPSAHITLLTTTPFEPLALSSGLFDAVKTGGRPSSVRDTFGLFAALRREKFQLVFDLQTSKRTKNYIYAFLPRPPLWSGISPSPYRQTRADRNDMHNLDRMGDQLAVAGVGDFARSGVGPLPDFRWAAELGRRGAQSAAERFGVKPPFALLVPGASPGKPEKFWPAESYGRLARLLSEAGLSPIVIGAAAERPLAKTILEIAPRSVDLTGRTDLFDLAALGEEAALCVGNDTGPTHLIAYSGAPGAMLMSRVTRPSHCAPRARMGHISSDDLSDLSPEAVLEYLDLGDQA
jgi:ADP-heptose:LPS heptosyltransferase